MAHASTNITPQKWLGSFPQFYPWVAVFAALDIAFTSVILAFGGAEVNAVADRALQAFGLAGLVAVKVISLAVAIACCEMLASRRPQAAKALAVLAVLVNIFPVLVGGSQLARVAWFVDDPRVWEQLVTGMGLPHHHEQWSESIALEEKVIRLRHARIRELARSRADTTSVDAPGSAARLGPGVVATVAVD